jgi:benzoyl-CoA reductase/2-hydroxyglutaryl-CoA dehydratase subunit BcrC/BadD/HgdB
MEQPTLWDRTKHAFESILSHSQKATEKVVDSLEELGDAAKARVEKARTERALLKKSAELGTRVYELSKEAPPPGSSPVRVFDDDRAKALLQDVGALHADLDKLAAELEHREDAQK